MTIKLTALSALVIAAAVAGGACNDGKSPQGSTMSDGNGNGNGERPLEGNPHSTTGPSSGYPRSDAGAYHPLTDDTKQYHPTDPANAQPNH